MTTELTVFLVDDDPGIRRSLSSSLGARGYQVQTFESAASFLAQYDTQVPGCILVDLHMPEMTGLVLQDSLNERDNIFPVIFITGHGEVPDSVRALKAGAVDFLQKPFRQDVLLEKLDEAFLVLRERLNSRAEVTTASERYKKLTLRESEVLGLLVAGQPNCSNKDIALALGISNRTVDHHRARIMEKMQAGNLVELIALATTANSTK